MVVSPAIAKLAFGEATQSVHVRATQPAFPPSAVREIDRAAAQREFGD
jgi:hypothetical protein